MLITFLNQSLTAFQFSVRIIFRCGLAGNGCILSDLHIGRDHTSAANGGKREGIYLGL